MTISSNTEISTDAIHRATRMAQQTGQNVVVYKAKVAKRITEICVVKKVWDKAQDKAGIQFLAIIDANGNYVD